MGSESSARASRASKKGAGYIFEFLSERLQANIVSGPFSAAPGGLFDTATHTKAKFRGQSQLTLALDSDPSTCSHLH